MQKALYLLCPTDCLESVINNTYHSDNYFYTSLGNSVVFDTNISSQIQKLINTHKITHITFVLSSNNNVVNDVLSNKDLSEIKSLDAFYTQIQQQKKYTQELWLNTSNHYLLSYYIRGKMNELQNKLKNRINHSVTISGKIYNRFDNVFENIYSKLIYLEPYRLN